MWRKRGRLRWRECQRKAISGLNPHEGEPLSSAPEQGEERGPRPQDLQPPPPPGHHKEEQEKSAGDERPATEPLFKALDTPLSEGDEPATLPAQRDLGNTVQMEGYLGRKHDLEGPNKKASNRCVGEGPPGRPSGFRGQATSRALMRWVLAGQSGPEPSAITLCFLA